MIPRTSHSLFASLSSRARKRPRSWLPRWISTLLAALEKKGLIEREVDPNDRRIVHVNLTEQGRAKAKQQREDMRDAVCWVFSQMGERRTREFVDLTEEFATYVTICIPGQPRPTAEEVKQAFAKAESEDPA